MIFTIQWFLEKVTPRTVLIPIYRWVQSHFRSRPFLSWAIDGRRFMGNQIAFRDVFRLHQNCELQPNLRPTSWEVLARALHIHETIKVDPRWFETYRLKGPNLSSFTGVISSPSIGSTRCRDRHFDLICGDIPPTSRVRQSRPREWRNARANFFGSLGVWHPSQWAGCHALNERERQKLMDMGHTRPILFPVLQAFLVPFGKQTPGIFVSLARPKSFEGILGTCWATEFLRKFN